MFLIRCVCYLIKNSVSYPSVPMAQTKEGKTKSPQCLTVASLRIPLILIQVSTKVWQEEDKKQMQNM